MDPRRRLPPPRSGLVRADPCEGRLPARAGETFSGVVRYVGDGDSLCLGPSTDPSTWIEVRLADFDAPEIHSPTGRVDRDRLSGLVRRRVLACVAVRGSNGRVIVYDRAGWIGWAVMAASSSAPTAGAPAAPFLSPSARGLLPSQGATSDPGSNAPTSARRTSGR